MTLAAEPLGLRAAGTRPFGESAPGTDDAAMATASVSSPVPGAAAVTAGPAVAPVAAGPPETAGPALTAALEVASRPAAAGGLWLASAAMAIRASNAWAAAGSWRPA